MSVHNTYAACHHPEKHGTILKDFIVDSSMLVSIGAFDPGVKVKVLSALGVTVTGPSDIKDVVYCLVRSQTPYGGFWLPPLPPEPPLLLRSKEHHHRRCRTTLRRDRKKGVAPATEPEP